jgi:putative transposase
MSDKFKNKYRIESARLKNWDYGWNASYFVTICTKNRTYFFGDVKNGEMVLNDIGVITQNIWQKIPEYFPYARLDAYVVMPNHIHGILTIDKSDGGIANDRGNKSDGGITNDRGNKSDGGITDDRGNKSDGGIADDRGNKSDGGIEKTRLIASLHGKTGESGESETTENTPPGGITGDKNPMINENLSKIIRWYKGRTTYETRKIQADFAWQPRFYDIIIKNEESYFRISEYIKNNPSKWQKDGFR